ncbi:hypothetical protein VHEMI07551 [[Torrubiella] hemipterigena]|uniref:Uncharacterized protein n=1 Tax=[Torrubiella] hemipterigena TaxID=1531966 RepID=A0A0A1TLV7_9HYPO|nr:hypothetical protein VHEMI07551 [[Torrubiella] hemipterigena]
MATLQSSDSKAIGSSRKRSSSQSLDDLVPKPQKKVHPPFPPTIFWDQLAEIPLTSNALRELRRRALVASYAQVTGQKVAQRDNCCVEQPVSVEASPSILKRIQRFAKNGGPDLSALRGHRALFEVSDNMSIRYDSTKLPSAASEKVYSSATPETMGPYDSAFQQHLIDYHIFPDSYEYPDGRLPPEPTNRRAILEALERPRASLSASTFSRADFHKFQRADKHAKTAREVFYTVIPTIEGEAADGRCVVGGIPFTNFDHLTNSTLVASSPDLFYGARPEQLDGNIRKELNGLVIPSTKHALPIAPNVFLQAKGPNTFLPGALLQACYNGALGARAMHSLQSYGQPTRFYDNKAYVLSWVYHCGTLRLFTVHPLPPPAELGGQLSFVTTHIKSWSMTGDYDYFLQGATAYRNGVDWAKQQRDEAIKEANVIAACKTAT